MTVWLLKEEDDNIQVLDRTLLHRRGFIEQAYGL